MLIASLGGWKAEAALMRAAGKGVAYKNLLGVGAREPGTRSCAHSPLPLEGPLSFDIQDPRAVLGKQLCARWDSGVGTAASRCHRLQSVCLFGL